MPRHCIAAFTILKEEWVIRAVKLVPNSKEAQNLDGSLVTEGVHYRES